MTLDNLWMLLLIVLAVVGAVSIIAADLIFRFDLADRRTGQVLFLAAAPFVVLLLVVFLSPL